MHDYLHMRDEEIPVLRYDMNMDLKAVISY